MSSIRCILLCESEFFCLLFNSIGLGRLVNQTVGLIHILYFNFWSNSSFRFLAFGFWAHRIDKSLSNTTCTYGD
jgi:hypothetical protein